MEIWELTFALRSHQAWLEAAEEKRRRQLTAAGEASPRARKPRFNTWGVIPSREEPQPEPTPSPWRRLCRAAAASWAFVRAFFRYFCMSSGALGLLLLIGGAMAGHWMLAVSGFGLMLFFILVMEAVFD